MLTLSDIDIGTSPSDTTSYAASVGLDVSQTTVTPPLRAGRPRQGDSDTLQENDDIQTSVNLNSRISESMSAGDYTIGTTTYYAAKSGAFTLEIDGLGEGSMTRPDLEVGTPSVDDANPATGATFNLSAAVTNAGDGESGAMMLRYCRSTNANISGADTEVGTEDIGVLSAAGTSDRSIELAAPSTAGTYYYGAYMDAVTDVSHTVNSSCFIVSRRNDGCVGGGRLKIVRASLSNSAQIGQKSDADDESEYRCPSRESYSCEYEQCNRHRSPEGQKYAGFR